MNSSSPQSPLILQKFSWVLVGSLFLLSVLGFVLDLRELMHDVVDRRMPLFSRQLVVQVASSMEKYDRASWLLTHDGFLMGWMDDGERDTFEVVRYLREKSTVWGFNESGFVSDDSLRYIGSDDRVLQMTEGLDRDQWYFDYRRQNKDRDFNYYTYPDTGETFIYLNYTIRDSSGRFRGVAAGALKAEHLFDEVHPLIEGTSSDFMLFNQSGEAMFDTFGFTGASERLKYSREFIRLGVEKSPVEHPFVKTLWKRGTLRIVSFSYVPRWDSYILIEQELFVLLGSALRRLALNFFIVLITAAILMVLNIRLWSYYMDKIASQSRELSHLVELRTSLMHSMAHNINSPLMVMLNLSRELLDEPGPPELQRVLMEDIFSSANTVSLYVRNILSYLRIDEESQQPMPTRFTLAYLVELVISSSSTQAKMKGISVETELTSREILLRGDVGMAQMIVLLLVENSIKFSPPGSQVVLFSHGYEENIPHNGETEQDTVSLFVGDGGPGFSSEDRERMFCKFQPLSARPTGGEKSLGLGLYLAKKLSELAGYSLVLEDSPRWGALFRIDFPEGKGKEGY